MSSPFNPEAAAIFARFFGSTISGTAGERSRPLVFHPILIGLPAETQSDEEASPSASRIYLVDPVSRGVAVLRRDPLFSEMLSGIKGPPPASKASIEALTKLETVDDGEDCSVYLNELKLGPGVIVDDEAQGMCEVKAMPCRHRFHGACIEKWLGMHGTCPVCRFCMPEEDVPAKKTEGDAIDARDGFERAIWFEVTFGGLQTRDQETEQGEEHV